MPQEQTTKVMKSDKSGYERVKEGGDITDATKAAMRQETTMARVSAKAAEVKAEDAKAGRKFPSRKDYSDDASYYKAIKEYRKNVEASKAGTVARAIEAMK